MKSLPTSHPTGSPDILVVMLRSGDRVLLLTGFGTEAPARVVGFDGERVRLKCWPFFYGEFLVWPAEVREPFDFAADERGRLPERLTIAVPADVGMELR